MKRWSRTICIAMLLGLAAAFPVVSQTAYPVKLDRSAKVTPDTTKRIYLTTNGSFTETSGKAKVTISSKTIDRAAGETQTWSHIGVPKKFYISGAAETAEYLISTVAATSLTLATNYLEATNASVAYTIASLNLAKTVRVINGDTTNSCTIYLIDQAGTIDTEGVTVGAGTEVTIWNTQALGVQFDAAQTNTSNSLTIELYREQ